MQELEESRYWLELLDDAEIIRPERLAPLISETGELIRIMITIAKRTKARY